MEELIQECVQQPIWAIVGYSENRRKFGHLVLHDLKKAGYVVFPVNSKGGVMDGLKVYASVKDLPVQPGVVNLVVPPQQGLKVVKECDEAGLTRVWMQPGAESEAAIEFCREKGIKVVYHACAMVEKMLQPK